MTAMGMCALFWAGQQRQSCEHQPLLWPAWLLLASISGTKGATLHLLHPLPSSGCLPPKLTSACYAVSAAQLLLHDLQGSSRWCFTCCCYHQATLALAMVDTCLHCCTGPSRCNSLGIRESCRRPSILESVMWSCNRQSILHCCTSQHLSPCSCQIICFP